MQESFRTSAGESMTIDSTLKENGATEILITLDTGRRCLLHWGLRRHPDASWEAPPRSVWPEGSRAFDQSAVQTPFSLEDGRCRLLVQLPPDLGTEYMECVLYFPDENRWENNRGLNYRIAIPKPVGQSSPLPLPTDEDLAGGSVRFEKTFHLEPAGLMETAVLSDDAAYTLLFRAHFPGPLLLHWGTAGRTRHEWLPPPASLQPPGTILLAGAAQTPFSEPSARPVLRMRIPRDQAPSALLFVVKEAATGRWLKEKGGNCILPVAALDRPEPTIGGARLQELADSIISAETAKNSWTLMHRFNLCFDLLDQVQGDLDGLALLYVWLRYSAVRQLDWQRNYNTKPRELAHSLDRLSRKLSERYSREPADRELVRMMMTTLGRGGDGQRVRDEILQIMHRHHIKEVSGHFMEEWHQKLHNNTTPDDVVICRAYLDFLRSDGNREAFYRTLEAGGVTRERLAGYERPIRSEPDFVPHLKDALIRDFEHFLGILKAVHEGTDLVTAADAARDLLPPELRPVLEDILQRHGKVAEDPARLLEEMAVLRRHLRERLEAGGGEVRDLLFLDLALEETCRSIIERGSLGSSGIKEMAAVMESLIEHLHLSHGEEETGVCLREWRRLCRTSPSRPTDWALQAKAVLDRLTRWLGAFIDRIHGLLQPKAEYLGKAFQAARWTVELFSEEVIRGRLEFALAAMVRRLDAVLRREAHLGAWQVISPGSARGVVEVVARLREAQGRNFSQPTILVTDKVEGDEEIPPGVTGVITSQPVDIVSHVAVRARNARLLFATCYDPSVFSDLRDESGKPLRFSVDAAGQVLFEPDRGSGSPQAETVLHRTRLAGNRSGWRAIPMEGFTREHVGGKSANLAKLSGSLPPWIHLPASVALPYGAFQRTLGEDSNREIRKRYEEWTAQVDEAPAEDREKILKEIRTAVLGLELPPDLLDSLHETAQKSGLKLPDRPESCREGIVRVWASKWNDRAYYSRKARGIPHDDLLMAVLIQEVVPAQYSYVIHTVNPLSGNRSEIYAELVLGLGETLVGNYPGRALSFISDKSRKEPQVLSFPSKSTGLYGSGLIFRSDSNGEDLAGYAGAGLYDSIMVPPPRAVRLDYSSEPVVWDENRRKELLSGVAAVASAVEGALGTPQDIEGAFVDGRYFVVQTRPQVGL